MRFDVRHARIILAIADEGSVTRAARRLGLPQPSLTSQLRRIEKELGVALFLRGPKGVTSTEEASSLIPHLRAIDASMSIIERKAKDSTTSKAAPLLLGVESTALLDALADYPTPPNARLQIVMAESESLLPSLLSGSLHLAITTDPGESSEKFPTGFRIATICEQEVGLVFPSNHELDGTSKIRLIDLKNEQWSSYPPGTALHDTLIQACESVGFIPHIRYFATSEVGMGRILARKDSISLGTQLLAADVGGQWQSIGLPSACRVIAAWNPSRIRPGVVASFVEHLRTHSIWTAAVPGRI